MNEKQFPTLQDNKQALELLLLFLNYVYKLWDFFLSFFVPQCSPPLPETQACLLSRVGCRCAGTFQPVHRSRAGAAARCRSTAPAAAAAACPGPDRTPPAPAWLLVRFFKNKSEGKKTKESCVATLLLSVCTDGAWASERTDINPPPSIAFVHGGGTGGDAFRDRGECGTFFRRRRPRGLLSGNWACRFVFKCELHTLYSK